MGIDMSSLVESLQSIQSVMEMNNAQITQLTDNQQRDQEHMQQVERLVEENAQQLRALTKSHIKAQQQNRELAEQNAKLLREIKRQRRPEPENKSQEEETGEGPPQIPHYVHPPPRKLDKQLVGYAYAYGQKAPAEKKEPKKLAVKTNVAQRGG